MFANHFPTTCIKTLPEQGVRETAGRGETQEVRPSNPESGEELLPDSELPLKILEILEIFILLFQVRQLRGQREEFFSEIKSQIKE